MLITWPIDKNILIPQKSASIIFDVSWYESAGSVADLSAMRAQIEPVDKTLKSLYKMQGVPN
jgi:hypothetical protein